MSQTRKIRSEGDEIGDLNVPLIMRMVERGDLDLEADEYFSITQKVWLPLAKFNLDFPKGIDGTFNAEERLGEMREAGIKLVAILGMPDDCAACKSLQQKRYAIEQAPSLPPTGCTCFPFCRCSFIAKR